MLKWNYTYDEKKKKKSHFHRICVECSTGEFFFVISRGRLFILAPLFSFNIPPLLGATFSDLDRGESDLIYSLH